MKLRHNKILLVDSAELKKLFSSAKLSVTELKELDKGIRAKINEGYIAGGYDLLNIIEKFKSFMPDFDVSFYKKQFIDYLSRNNSAYEFVKFIFENEALKKIIETNFTDEELKQIDMIIVNQKYKDYTDFTHV